MSETGIDFTNYYWIVLSVIVLAPIMVMARSLARQAEALERIAATLEKRG